MTWIVVALFAVGAVLCAAGVVGIVVALAPPYNGRENFQLRAELAAGFGACSMIAAFAMAVAS